MSNKYLPVRTLSLVRTGTKVLMRWPVQRSNPEEICTQTTPRTINTRLQGINQTESLAKPSVWPARHKCDCAFVTYLQTGYATATYRMTGKNQRDSVFWPYVHLPTDAMEQQNLRSYWAKVHKIFNGRRGILVVMIMLWFIMFLLLFNVHFFS